MKKFAVVAVGYNRLSSLKRLLAALENAEYGSDHITLIISLDFYHEDILRVFAEKFHWSHGNKILNFYDTKQGLRKHILQCGNYLNKYDLDAIAVFEDDILPSRAYYMYMKEAVNFYENSCQIAGIALYSFRINPFLRRPFYPILNGQDTFLMQFPCSWGQIWTREQWNGFYNWYLEHENIAINADNIPVAVSDWPSSSWLKYYTKYCVEKNKYFVYPYTALSTNFNEPGTHVKEEDSIFQLVIQEQVKQNYSFCDTNSEVLYDVFFERIGLGKTLGIEEKDLCVDLYGSKGSHGGKRYWLTTVKRDYKVVDTFGRKMIPQEQNIIYSIKGSSIYLYDTMDMKDTPENLEKNILLCKEGKKLVLYGAGDIGNRWLEHLGSERVYCFADTNKTGEVINGKKVLSLDILKNMQSDIKIYISTSYEKKDEIYKKLVEAGLEKNVVGSPYLDKDIFAEWDTFIDEKSELEGRNAFLKGVQLHCSKLGYASYIAAKTALFNTYIGRYCSIGPNVRIVVGQHPTRNFVSTHPIFYSTQQIIKKTYVTDNLFEEHRVTKNGYMVEIGNDVWIGDGAVLMEGVTIADGTIVASGANVVKDTEPYSIVGGNPAKIIRYRFDEEQRKFLLNLQWWNKGETWIEKYADSFYDVEKLKLRLKEKE